MAQLQLKKPIIFFDLETTGTDHVKDRVIELALVKIMPDGSKDHYVKRVNPCMAIPPESTAIHHITDADVAQAPTFKQIAHQLYEWMKHCDLAGYNSNKFDIPMLAEEFLRAGINVDFTERNMIDVQQIFFKMETRTLSAAYRFYCDKPLEDAHSAMADVAATIEILESQLDRYPDLPNEVAALHVFTAGGEEMVDYARRIVLKDGHPVFNFGKHKGKRVTDVFLSEPQYYDWMMNADFTLHTKQKISEILNRMKFAGKGVKV